MNNNENLPDTQLMLRFCQGDDIAFTQLMDRNFPKVVRIIHRFVGHTQDAEDLAQEVFLRIYNARQRYVASARFDTWLYHIITNLCINHIRDNKHRQVVPIYTQDSDHNIQPLNLPDQSQETPSHIMMRLELCEKVKQALLALPSNQRLAVILSKYEGLSYQQIAQVMGISLEAVKSLLNRAKMNLKQLLTKNAKSSSDLILR